MKFENIRHSYKLLESICSDFFLKCGLSIAYVFYSFGFDQALENAMVAVLFLIVFDFITGIAAAKISHEVIKSSKIFRSALKIAIYFLLISAGHLGEVAIGANFFIDEFIVVFLAATELISVIENIGKMGFAVPKKILNQLEKIRDGK